MSTILQVKGRLSLKLVARLSMLPLDTHTALLAQSELLNKQLAEGCLNKANVSRVKSLKCDFCGGGHENGRYFLEVVSEEAQFAIFHKNNPYSNSYNMGWKDHSNFHRSNNQNQSGNQAMQQNQQASNFQRKPSQLEETLQNFIKATQSGLEQANKNHEILARNHEASIKNLETHIGQLSRQIVAFPSSSGGFIGNTVDNPKNETCKVMKTDFGLVTRNEKVEKIKRIKWRKRKMKLKRRRMETKVTKRKEESPLITSLIKILLGREKKIKFIMNQIQRYQII